MSASSYDLPLLGGGVLCAGVFAWGIARAVSLDARPRDPMIAAVLLWAIQSFLYLRHTVDDALITFRFAEHWMSGHGPVYQVGERVEGYTCFAWLGLLSLAGALGVPLESAAKALGAVFALATLFGIHRLLRALSTPRAALLGPILLGASPLFAAWTFAGMDAPMFAAALTWATVLYVEELRTLPAFRWSGLAFGLAVLVRPEGILFAGIAAIVLASELRAHDRRAGFIRWAIACAAVAVPYWSWRWAYYGDFFPNTFYAKTGLSIGTLFRGGTSVADFLSDQGTLCVALAAVGLWALVRRGPAAVFIVGSVLGFLAYCVWTGGDVLHLRFYVHILPLWFTCAAVGLDRIATAAEALASTSRRLAWATAGVLSAIWIVGGFHEHARARHPRDQFGVAYVVNNATNIRAAHGPLGDWLRAHAPASSVVAATDIGAIGYRSRLPILDLYGLVDRPIAHLMHRRATGAELAANVRKREPSFIVLYGTSRGPSLGWLASEAEWIHAHYRLHSLWPDSPQDKGLVLLVRDDVTVPEAAPPGIELEGGAPRVERRERGWLEADLRPTAN